MALVLNDRVKETSTTSGTGTFNLDGASTGFVTFVAGIGNSNTTYYAIHEQGTANWEVGRGTVTDATPDTLARTEVLNNSLGNTSKIDDIMVEGLGPTGREVRPFSEWRKIYEDGSFVNKGRKIMEFDKIRRKAKDTKGRV